MNILYVNIIRTPNAWPQNISQGTSKYYFENPPIRFVLIPIACTLIFTGFLDVAIFDGYDEFRIASQVYSGDVGTCMDSVGLGNI